MKKFYVTETTTYEFVADSVFEADDLYDEFRENGVDFVDGMWMVGDVQVKVADTGTEKEW